jgi:RNA polymerase sigma factor (sigma-70 family)
MSDEQLWRLSCEGDREAFSRIVERYQSLICSLAYSACGVLGASEDMAQETFITAWHRLKELREPGKLRPWLCGIVRHIAANAVRRDLRRGGAPESLDAIPEEASLDADPAAQAITREEEALLWRALAGLPENYREPMVLFYREQQSVAEVASDLDMSEETVRQRLSRGRSMLREEMTSLVESTLTRTRPGPAFRLAVMVALPVASASTASAALTAGAMATHSAGTVGKGWLANIGLGTLLGPAIGLLVAGLGTKAAASTARSAPERKLILRYARWITAFCFAMSIGLAVALTQAGKLYPASAPWIFLGICTWVVVLVGVILLVCQRLDREVKRIRVETNTTGEAANSRCALN